MAGGLEGREPVREMFLAQAKPGDKPPLTVQKLISEPPSAWQDTLKKNGPPNSDLGNFEHNLRHQADRLVDLGVHNISRQIDRMRKGFEPVDPSNGNPVVKALYEGAIEEARRNPEFGKDDLTRMGQSLKDSYGEQINKVMDALRNPVPDKPEPAPERTQSVQAPGPGVTLA